MPSSTRTPLVRDALEPWCAAGVSGALRVLDPPGGAIYLTDGSIEYAESPVASSPERLLTASGRIPPEAWRAAVASGKPQSRIGEDLVAGGAISTAEFEYAVIMATYDAAHFLFDLHAEVRFAYTDAHPFGRVRALPLRIVSAEVDRRRRLLADAWPDPAIDTAAVLPLRRLRSDCVALTALQWEVVANADRRRSPIDLARLLGRDAFTVMLEVRRMVRAGLVEPGRPGGSAAAGTIATVRARAAAHPPTARSDAPTVRPSDAAKANGANGATGAAGVAEAAGANTATAAKAADATNTADEGDLRRPLPRRGRATDLPGPSSEDWAPPLPETMLRRLIDGLEALR